MKILHYSLGMPPYRSGGLTQYVMSLIDSQSKNGVDVFLLYPSGVRLFSKMQIKKCRKAGNVGVFKIINPMPVPLLYGVKDPADLMDESMIDEGNIAEFISTLSPDVLHIHTFMGLPRILLYVARKQGIKIVYTTHDYFGLCLKVNFIDNLGALCEYPEHSHCAICNKDSHGTRFLKLRNEPFLSHLKSLHSYCASVKRHGTGAATIYKKEMDGVAGPKILDYSLLADYYMDMFNMIDRYHFNSSVSMQVYTGLLPGIHGTVIPITHSGIKDNRRLKKFSDKTLRIGFIGHIDPYKGFDVLKRAVLKTDGCFTLNVWGNRIKGVDNDSDKIRFCGLFDYSQQANVYENMDILVVPSIWKETFSLVVLEALSYGVPVIVSKNVGAKDIVAEYNPNFIYNTEDNLRILLNAIMHDRNILVAFNKRILEGEWKYSMTRHISDIKRKLYM